MLQKDASYQGFYTDDKVDRAIEDSIDWLASEMMLVDQGWMNNISYITTASGEGQWSLTGTNFNIVNVVRFLVGDTYVVIPYNDGKQQNNYQSNQSVAFPGSWRLVGTNLYINPPPANYGTDQIQIEGTEYPTYFTASGDLAPQFDRGMYQFIKYHGSSLLANQIGKKDPEWEKKYMEWKDKIQKMINARNDSITFVQAWFGGDDV